MAFEYDLLTSSGLNELLQAWMSNPYCRFRSITWDVFLFKPD